MEGEIIMLLDIETMFSKEQLYRFVDEDGATGKATAPVNETATTIHQNISEPIDQ